MVFNFDKAIIGTTWDIKKARINSPYKQLQYAKRDGDKDRIEYWSALISIRKKQREFLDKEWTKNKKYVKDENDFRNLVELPADKKAENYFKKSSQDLHTGNFGEELIRKYN